MSYPNYTVIEAATYFEKQAAAAKTKIESLWLKLGELEVLFWKALLADAKTDLETIEQIATKLENDVTQFQKSLQSPSNSMTSRLISSLNFWGGGTQSQKLTGQQRLHTECELILAEVFLGFVILRVREQAYVKVAWYLRKSWKAFESISTLTDLDAFILGRIKVRKKRHK